MCFQSSPQGQIRPPPFPTHQAQGHLSGQDWQMDFTHVPHIKHFHHLLTWVDTFTGWIEAFPTTNEKASEAAKVLLKEIKLSTGTISS